MARKKKRPEFELPTILVSAVQEYLGPTDVNKLRPDQAAEIMSICSYAASKVGEAITRPEIPPGPVTRDPAAH